MIFNSPPRIEIYHELYDLKRKLSNRVIAVNLIHINVWEWAVMFPVSGNCVGDIDQKTKSRLLDTSKCRLYK